MWALILGFVESLFAGFLKYRSSAAERLGISEAKADIANQNVKVLNAEAESQVKIPCSNAAMIDLLDKGKL